jgi:hypothetical protein
MLTLFALLGNDFLAHILGKFFGVTQTNGFMCSRANLEYLKRTGPLSLTDIQTHALDPYLNIIVFTIVFLGTQLFVNRDWAPTAGKDIFYLVLFAIVIVGMSALRLSTGCTSIAQMFITIGIVGILAYITGYFIADKYPQYSYFLIDAEEDE